MISAVRQKSKFEFRTFLKKNLIFGFPWCSIREDLSIDVSITNVGLILTKLWWYLVSAFGNTGYGKSSISSISNFLKIFHIFGFPWCSTREDLSIDVFITNVGLILTKIRWFLFSGCGQTDGRTDRQTDTGLESSHGNMSAHKKFQLKAQN